MIFIKCPTFLLLLLWHNMAQPVLHSLSRHACNFSTIHTFLPSQQRGLLHLPILGALPETLPTSRFCGPSCTFFFQDDAVFQLFEAFWDVSSTIFCFQVENHQQHLEKGIRIALSYVKLAQQKLPRWCSQFTLQKVPILAQSSCVAQSQLMPSWDFWLPSHPLLGTAAEAQWHPEISAKRWLTSSICHKVTKTDLMEKDMHATHKMCGYYTVNSWDCIVLINR